MATSQHSAPDVSGSRGRDPERTLVKHMAMVIKSPYIRMGEVDLTDR